MSRLVAAYGLGRIAFAVAALAAPRAVGFALAGTGGATPDARAFLRGMGGRDLALGLGVLASVRRDQSPLPWLLAGACADLGDVAGIAGSWAEMAPDRRGPGLAFAAGAGVAGLGLALLKRERYATPRPVAA
jgi:hypothetical protein